MSGETLSGKLRRSVQLRTLLVPDWLWQLTWLRHLPEYYLSVLRQESRPPRWQIVFDLLYIFFKLKVVPEHYGPCRLWDVPRKDWVLYYGSPYTPLARARLAKRIYPVHYEVLYDDKLVGAQLCKGLDVRQPTIYGTLQPGESSRHRLESILNASGQSRLMLKPVFGRSGMGIVILERTDAGIIVHTRDGDVPLSEFQLDWPVFLQEVIQQHPAIASIWNSSVNTIRVITLQSISGEVVIVGGGMRFGVGKSYVDNWSAGGVSVGVNTRTGRLRKFAYDKWGNEYTHHPSSGVQFDGFQLPHWQAILDTARKVQRELSFSRLGGADICLDQDGTPVVIEVNGLPDLVPREQLNGPLLAEPEILRAFADNDLLVSEAQRRLLKDIRLAAIEPATT